MSNQINFREQVRENWVLLLQQEHIKIDVFQEIARLQRSISLSQDAVTKFKGGRKLLKLQAKCDEAKEGAVSRAVKVFENAYGPSAPGMVVGGRGLRSDADVLVNFGVNYSLEKPSCPKRLLDSIALEPNGGVMCDTPWSLLTNHAFILGGINSQKRFYLHVSAEHHGEIRDELLWDEKANKPTVLALEIAMLYEAGYRQVIPDEQIADFGATFVSLNPEKAEKMSLQDILEVTTKQVGLPYLRSLMKGVENG